MGEIVLPEKFTNQGIYPITFYEDEKGTFIKCIKNKKRR